jgi:outer membrane lipoprotein-sorting protein
MNRRKATLGAAVVGVVAGAVGLGLLAAPAGAGQAPTLPGITPDALVQSVLTTSPPAMAGTVQIVNNLGLPAVPGLPAQLSGGSSQIRVWTDGANHSRISMPSMNSDETIVNDGTTVYDWDSTTHTVTEHHLSKAANHQPAPKTGDTNAGLDPASAARQLVAAVKQTSTVSVSGTDTVANRAAYDLVLTPKPDQRTLLRQVRIAIDAQTRIPLQLTVLANNTDTPAVQFGFSSLDIGAQDPSLFHFTVPAGATVINGDNSDNKSATMATKAAPTVVGKGWETVLVAQLPTTVNTPSDQPARPGKFGSSSSSSSMLGLVRQFGKPVSGAWGSGWVISTDVGNVLITSDNRVAAGFVPQQLLISALGK